MKADVSIGELVDKVVEIIGETLNLILGDKTTVPILMVTEEHPYWYIF